MMNIQVEEHQHFQREELRKLCKTDPAAEPDLFDKCQQLDKRMMPLVETIEKMLTAGICRNFHMPTSDCTLQEIKCQILKCVTLIINDIINVVDREDTKLVMNTEEKCPKKRNESNASQMIEALAMMDDEAKLNAVKGIEDTFLNQQSIGEGCSMNTLLEKWYCMNQEEMDKRMKSCRTDLVGDDLVLIDPDTVSGRVKAWLVQKGMNKTCGNYDVTSIILHVLMDHIGKCVLHSDRDYKIEKSGACTLVKKEQASEMRNKKRADVKVMSRREKTLREFAKGYVDGIILKAQEIVLQDSLAYADFICEAKQNPASFRDSANVFAKEIVSNAQIIVQKGNAIDTLKHQNGKGGKLKNNPTRNITEPVFPAVVKATSDAMLEAFAKDYVHAIIWNAQIKLLKELKDNQKYKVYKPEKINIDSKSQTYERRKAELIKFNKRRQAKMESQAFQKKKAAQRAEVSEHKKKRSQAVEADLRVKELNNGVNKCIGCSPSATPRYAVPIKTKSELEKESEREWTKEYIDEMLKASLERLKVGGNTKHPLPRNRLLGNDSKKMSLKNSTESVPQVQASDTLSAHNDQETAMRDFAKTFVSNVIQTAQSIVTEEGGDTDPKVDGAPLKKKSKKSAGAESLPGNNETDNERPDGFCGFIGLCRCQIFSCLKRQSST